MTIIICINRKIYVFKKKKISINGDKSLSIRFILLSSLSIGKSTAYNILKSEDVLNSINCIRKLGIKVISILETNSDPNVVDIPIPANDDAVRSIKLIISVLADAIKTGKQATY